MSRPPRVLFVANVAWFFASHRLPLALAARDAGWDVHVAAAPDGGEALQRAGLPLHPLPVVRGASSLTSELGTLRSLYALYRHLQPQVVHHVTIKPVLYGTLAARLARVPRIVNAVSGLGSAFLATDLRGRLRRTALRALLRGTLAGADARFIFQNPDDQAAYVALGVSADRSILVPGVGVDLHQFQVMPEPPGRPTVVCPARLLGDKGIREFAAAAGLARAAGVDADWCLVGDLDPGNPTAIPLEEVESWVRDGILRWEGFRSDMAHVFAQAHIVALPSYREGMPKALLEAAACGRAIVTTDVPGCRDAVDQGVAGLLVPVRDPARLADAVVRLVQDPAERRRLGTAARALAERRFDEREVIRATLALYGDGASGA